MKHTAEPQRLMIVPVLQKAPLLIQLWVPKKETKGVFDKREKIVCNWLTHLLSSQGHDVTADDKQNNWKQDV